MLKLRPQYIGILVGTLSMLWLISAGRAEPGIFDDRIVFGQSAAFKGPAAALGLGMRQGILTAFEEANAKGGVNGRKLELVSYNDGYEPNKAIVNTKRLLEEDKVFALLGEVGTPHFSPLLGRKLLLSHRQIQA